LSINNYQLELALLEKPVFLSLSLNTVLKHIQHMQIDR